VSEEAKQEEAVETNPLITVLDRIMDEAQQEDGSFKEIDTKETFGVTDDELAEFVSSVVYQVVTMGDEAAEGLGKVLDLSDLGFLVSMGIQVGIEWQKGRASE